MDRAPTVTCTTEPALSLKEAFAAHPYSLLEGRMMSTLSRMSIPAFLASAVLTLPGSQSRVQGAKSPIADTGQVWCYDNFAEIPAPEPGQPFYGQDAQYRGLQPAYRDNGDGTVTDLHTGLMWQKTPGVEQYTWAEAAAYAADLRLAGYDDWRVPTIKELYSIVLFTGNLHELKPWAMIPSGRGRNRPMRRGWAKYWITQHYGNRILKGAGDIEEDGIVWRVHRFAGGGRCIAGPARPGGPPQQMRGPGGLVIAHNINPRQADARYLEAIQTNPNLETLILNYSDGVSITLKKRPGN